MMDNLLLLVSYAALVLFNSIDSILTRIAIKRGHQEKNPFMRNLIRKYGLDRAILIKSLAVPMTGVFIILVWNIPILSLDLTIVFSILAILLFVVVCNGLFQLLRAWKLTQLTQKILTQNS
jgi:hypothetical protein